MESGNLQCTQVTVTGINDLPLISGIAITPTINDHATTTPFTPLSVTDIDDDDVSVNITYTAANGGLSGTGLTGNVGNYTLSSDKPATVSSRLQGLTFTPTINQVAVGSSTVTTFTLHLMMVLLMVLLIVIPRLRLSQ